MMAGIWRMILVFNILYPARSGWIMAGTWRIILVFNI